MKLEAPARCYTLCFSPSRVLLLPTIGLDLLKLTQSLKYRRPSPQITDVPSLGPQDTAISTCRFACLAPRASWRWRWRRHGKSHGKKNSMLGSSSLMSDDISDSNNGLLEARPVGSGRQSEMGNGCITEGPWQRGPLRSGPPLIEWCESQPSVLRIIRYTTRSTHCLGWAICTHGGSPRAVVLFGFQRYG